MRNVYKILVEKPEEKGPLERSSRRWMIFKCILKEQVVRALTGFNWLSIECSGGL
jgi:hypothetical protein